MSVSERTSLAQRLIRLIDQDVRGIEVRCAEGIQPETLYRENVGQRKGLMAARDHLTSLLSSEEVTIVDMRRHENGTFQAAERRERQGQSRNRV